MMAPKKGLAVKKNPWYNFMTQVAPDGSWNISKRWVSGYLQIDGIHWVLLSHILRHGSYPVLHNISYGLSS